MKERKLKFRTNDNKALVPIDLELIEKTKKAYANIRLNISFMIEQWEKGELEQGMYETHLKLVETYAKEFTGLFDYAGILQKENEERYSEIRAVNTENHELRKQLGQKVTNEDLRERIKNITEQFKKWWNIYGFGHISNNDIGFTGYGAFQITLSGMTTDAYYAKNGEVPEGYNKQEALKSMGFELEGSESHARVISNDKNIGLLKNLLIEKYPSIEIDEIKTVGYGKNNTIEYVKVRITNLDEFTEKL